MKIIDPKTGKRLDDKGPKLDPSLKKTDPLKRTAEKGMEAEEESSPMDPPEAYGHQGERTLEPGQRHALIARYMEEHQAALAVLARFEEAMNAYKTSGYKLDDSINDALREFFAIFDDKLLDHNRREETELFPLLHERMLATGEHSGGSERSTAIDLMEDDHVKFIQLGALVFNLLGLAARLPDLGSRMFTFETAFDNSRELIELLRLHIHREDHVLFPIAQDLITAEEMDQNMRS